MTQKSPCTAAARRLSMATVLLLGACGENPFDAAEVPDLPFRYEVEALSLPGDSVHILGWSETGRLLFTGFEEGGSQPVSYIREPSGDMTFLGGFAATDFNEVGQVVGTLRRGYPPGPVIWEEGELKPIPGLFEPWTPTAINNHGEIAVATGGSAVRWLAGVTDPFPGHAIYESPTDINDAGEILVYLDDYGAEKAFRWSRSGVTPVGGGRGTRATAINERGAVVSSGRSRGPSPTWGTLVLRDETWINLGTLFPEPTPIEKWGTGVPLEKTIPIDVNDHTEVVGMATRITGEERGFYWSDGEIVDINALVRGSWIVTSAGHINNAGDIVGWAHSGDAIEVPVILRRVARE